MWIAIAALFLGGIFVAEVGRRAKAGRLSRNPLVGIRSRDTLADDQAWQRVHAAAGSWLVAAGVVGAVAAVGAAALGITDASQVVVAALLIGGTAAMVVLVVLGARIGDRATADRPS